MKKKIALGVVGVILFATGFFIGDSGATNNANKLKDAYNKGITEHMFYYHIGADKIILDKMIDDITSDPSKVIEEWNN